MYVKKHLGDKWLKFIYNFLLPIGAVGALIRIIVLIVNADSLPEGYVGSQILSSLISLGLCGALFIGLKQRAVWAWYLMFAMLILSPVGAAVSRIPTNQGNQEVTAALLIIGLLCWTLPNGIYFYRRRAWFGVSSGKQITTNQSTSNYLHVSDQEEMAFAQANIEFEKGVIREGLWAKALAEADGLERQKQRYMQYRAAQIVATVNQEQQTARKTARVFWLVFVAKRIGFGVLLLFISSIVHTLSYVLRPKIPLKPEDFFQQYAPSVFFDSIEVIALTCVVIAVFGFPFYLIWAVMREAKKRKIKSDFRV